MYVPILWGCVLGIHIFMCVYIFLNVYVRASMNVFCMFLFVCVYECKPISLYSVCVCLCTYIFFACVCVLEFVCFCVWVLGSVHNNQRARFWVSDTRARIPLTIFGLEFDHLLLLYLVLFMRICISICWICYLYYTFNFILII